MSQAIKLASTMALFYALVSAPAFGQENLKGPVCTLSDSQTQKSIKAFARIADFVTHEPRCVNCHGAVNPYVKHIGDKDPEDPSDPPASTVEHGGGQQDHEHNVGEDGTAEMDRDCNNCHGEMAPRRDGSTNENWSTAPGFRSFLNKDAATLCKQFKVSTGSAEDFMGHLKDDNGTANFAGTAFLGTRGLNSVPYLDKNSPSFVKPAPPSISQAAFLKMGQDWIDAMGGEFKGDEECGCVPARYAIRLTYRSEYGSGRAGWKVSSKADIPITFADDQSFTGQAPVNSQGDLGGGCLQVAAGVAIKASGNAIETAEKHAMHLQFESVSASTGTITVTCLGVSQSFGFSKQNMEMGQLPTFELKGMVGEAVDRRVNPYSNLRLEIVKREP